MAVFRKEVMIHGKPALLRNAEIGDEKVLIDLVKHMDEETVFLSREPGEYRMTEAQERARILSCAEKKNCRYAVAVMDGQIVGMSLAVFGEKIRYRHAGEISIGVARANWGQGIGRTLLEANLSWLQESGVERVTLTVDTQNAPALKLYQSLGFVVEGRLIHERKLADGTYRDDYRMALDFSAGDKNTGK